MIQDKPDKTNWWKCSLCGYTIQKDVPPVKCPGCKQTCMFTDVTCYTPECGGTGNSNSKWKSGDKS